MKQSPDHRFEGGTGRLLVSGLFVLTLCLLSGCSGEPDRDNPADPGSQAYVHEGTLQIDVRNNADQPLAEVLVLLPGAVPAARTAADGLARLSLEPGNYTVHIERQGYVPDSLDAVIVAHRTLEQEIRLNGSPMLEHILFRTYMHQEDLEPDRFQYGYKVTATTADPDGPSDIERVALRDAQEDYLLFTQQGATSLFQLQRDFSYFIAPLEANLNTAMDLHVVDDHGDSTVTEVAITSFFSYRYLHNDMLDSSPYINGELVFEWLNPRAVTSFTPDTYRLEIFLSSATSPLLDTLLQYEETDMDTFRVDLSGLILENANHQWRLTAYDPFGNEVRAGRTTFLPVFNDAGQTHRRITPGEQPW